MKCVCRRRFADFNFCFFSANGGVTMHSFLALFGIYVNFQVQYYVTLSADQLQNSGGQQVVIQQSQ